MASALRLIRQEADLLATRAVFLRPHGQKDNEGPIFEGPDGCLGCRGKEYLDFNSVRLRCAWHIIRH